MGGVVGSNAGGCGSRDLVGVVGIECKGCSYILLETRLVVMDDAFVGAGVDGVVACAEDSFGIAC